MAIHAFCVVFLGRSAVGAFCLSDESLPVAAVSGSAAAGTMHWLVKGPALPCFDPNQLSLCILRCQICCQLFGIVYAVHHRCIVGALPRVQVPALGVLLALRP
jgi:hypothetical protein